MTSHSWPETPSAKVHLALLAVPEKREKQGDMRNMVHSSKTLVGPRDGMPWVLTRGCFSNAILAYRGLLHSMALVLATASDTAPMAMLPQSTGSAGSGSVTGFSARLSFIPGGKNIEKSFLPRKFDCKKTIFLMLYLQMWRPSIKKGWTLRLERIVSTSTLKRFSVCSNNP